MNCRLGASVVKASNYDAWRPGFESSLSQRSLVCLLITFAHTPLGLCKWESRVEQKVTIAFSYRVRVLKMVL